MTINNLTMTDLTTDQAKVLTQVMIAYNLNAREFFGASKRRFQQLVEPRFMACYLQRQFCRYGKKPISWTKIGEAIGKDHATAYYGYSKIRSYLNIGYPDIIEKVNQIEMALLQKDAAVYHRKRLHLFNRRLKKHRNFR